MRRKQGGVNRFTFVGLCGTGVGISSSQLFFDILRASELHSKILSYVFSALSLSQVCCHLVRKASLSILVRVGICVSRISTATANAWGNRLTEKKGFLGNVVLEALFYYGLALLLWACRGSRLLTGAQGVCQGVRRALACGWKVRVSQWSLASVSLQQVTDLLAMQQMQVKRPDVWKWIQGIG